MSNIKKLMMSAAGGAGLDVDEVFSTYVYTGTGATRSINNGIDLAGEGGLVWIKTRSHTAGHSLQDTERGAGNMLSSNGTWASSSRTDSLTSFNSNGFSLGADTAGYVNYSSAYTYASWTFRKAPKFFDVVTYTGTGSARSVSHNLGHDVGMVIVKKTSGSSSSWRVWHRGLGGSNYLTLDTTAASASSTAVFSSAPTSTQINLGHSGSVNASGESYVAYLFAHNNNDGEFGPSGDQDIIKCGSFTAGANVNVDIGFEPQWVLVRHVDGSHWIVVDSMRGFLALPGESPYSRGLRANDNTVERNSQIQVTSTGFATNANAEMGFTGTVIYIAIRRGSLFPPESATDVFNVTETNSGFTTEITTGFAVDTQLATATSQTSNRWIVDRLRGVRTDVSISTPGLRTNSTDQESPNTGYSLWWDNTGFAIPAEWASINTVFYNWKRAPGFFDVVAYTGTGQPSRAITHNLGVSPELVIVKQRSAVSNWFTWCSALGNDHHLFINSTSAKQSSTLYMRSATDTVFNLGTQSSGVGVNSSGVSHIMYLFATLAGVSKVGSYTGNGSSQTIDCGFSASARYILIKRTDSTGDWYVWDTARGIVAGNDPHLSLTSNVAEVTSDDSVDPANSGFIVNQVSATNINVSSATYVFYAVA